MTSGGEDSRVGGALQEAPSDTPFDSRGHSSEPIYHSRDLLCGGSTARIDHGGERYTLRVTRQGKLILTK